MRRLAIFGAALVAALAAATPASASTHWCRQGDPPIQASARTSCALAGAALNRWMNGRLDSRESARVYSPTTGRAYRLRYQQRPGEYSSLRITATGPHGIWLRFTAW
jgi:hypothetical protein